MTIGLLLSPVSSPANEFLCGGEDFTPKYLPVPHQLFVEDIEYVGFRIEDSGKLLALDCDLQRKETELSLLRESVNNLNLRLTKKTEQYETVKVEYDKSLSKIIRLETDLADATTRAEKCETDTGMPWWRTALFVGLSFIVGGSVGLASGAILSN